ncbi:MAG TPA: rhodanese-like domain-containing protein [Dehalococcoidia bacterium]|nr:rhodanese-like domain-containing protein [Dehalococcoidia bacterium]
MKIIFSTRCKLLLLTLIWLLLSSFVIAGSCEYITGAGSSSQPSEQRIYDITVNKASNLIQENAGNPGFIILDVRTPEEYSGGHIEGAINIDFLADDIRAQLNKLDKTKSYLVYCRSGRRSSDTRDIMAELGFKEVYNISGGIGEWEAKGLPVVR